MKGHKPLLSIVVPTKGRYPYLFNLLKLIHGFHAEEMEIIVQDNNEDNTPILKYFDELGGKPSYIVYDWHKESLPISLNSDYAILNSSGEYVCFIGDDDGICSQIFYAVKYMQDNAIDALLSSTTFYNWPDFYDHSIFNLSSSIQFIKGDGEITKIDVRKEMHKCIKGGFDSLYKMPRVYQGIVSRRKLDQIYSIYGSYFPGPSPDMANAIALTQIDLNCYYFNGPLIISGQSRSVGGGERLLKKNQLKKLHEVHFLPHNIYEIWNNRLPKYWCVDTIWPQSGIMAIKDKFILDEINYNLILARFVFYHRHYYGECKLLIENSFKFYLSFLLFFIRKINTFIEHRLTYILSKKNRLGKLRIVKNIDNMKDAINYLSHYSFK